MDGAGERVIELGHDLQQISEFTGRTSLLGSDCFLAPGEGEYLRKKGRPESLAGIFAAKEALVKAWPGIPSFCWTDIEVVHDRQGAPAFRFHNQLQEHVRRAGWRIKLSISHSGDYASAVVLIYCDAEGRLWSSKT